MRERVPEVEVDNEELVQGEFGEAIEKRNWKKVKSSNGKPYHCLTSLQGTSCKFGPWRNRKDLNSHLKAHHSLSLPNLKLGRPLGPRGANKKKTVNSKKMNYAVMSDASKRAKKLFWKRSVAWKKKAEDSWAALVEESQVDSSIKACPILLSIVRDEGMLDEFLGTPWIGDGPFDMQKCENLHNNQAFANLVLQIPSSNRRVTKEIRSYFNAKDWKKNTKFRKAIAQQMFDWHQITFISNRYVINLYLN